MKALKNRIALIALVALFSVAFTAPALANNEKNKKDSAPVELKYLGKYKNQPVFEVSFVNGKDVTSEFVVTIRDNESNFVFRDVVKAGTTSKKYLLDTEEAGDLAIQFEITEKKSNRTAVYQINKSARVVEDLAVNKL